MVSSVRVFRDQLVTTKQVQCVAITLDICVVCKDMLNWLIREAWLGVGVQQCATWCYCFVCRTIK